MLSFYLMLIDDDKDRIEFEAIYYTHRKMMWLVAYNTLHNTYDAEDAVHEAFLGIARHMKKISGMSSNDTLAYLITSAKNAAIDMRRKRSYKIQENAIDIEECKDVSDTKDLPVEESIITKESFSDLVAAILSLDEIYADTLYYHFVDELSASKIAKKMEVNVGTVNKRITRGRKKLIIMLNSRGESKNEVKI